MIEENDLKTRLDEAEESVKQALSDWIEDFGDSGYSSSYSSREDDRIQLYPAWGDAELVPNNGDCILEHAYVQCSDLAPGHIINDEKVKAFVSENIK